LLAALQKLYRATSGWKSIGAVIKVDYIDLIVSRDVV